METKTFDKEEYNKLCADVLGAIYSEPAKAWGFGNAKNIGSKMFHGVRYHNVIEAQRFEKELKFHSDWNCIMEVVDAIEGKGFDVFINSCVCRVADVGENRFEDIETFVHNNKKQSVVLAIWEFLNYYNEIKK